LVLTQTTTYLDFTHRSDIRIGVNDEIKIYRNGQPARLADLQQGDLAAVLALKD
jgi:hypothetical protein